MIGPRAQPTLIDASGIVSLLADEPAAAIVEEVLRAGSAAISAVNLGEVRDVLQRVRGHPGESIDNRLFQLLEAGMEVLAVDSELGRLAGQLRAEEYRRGISEVSLADCILVATALRLAGRAATSDAALARMARARGVDVIALPNSAGQLPS